MNIIEQLNAEQCAKIEEKRKLPMFYAGDTLRVLVRVTEGTRTRVQAYEGVCIARSGGGLNETFTVRKISYGEGVERVFPVLQGRQHVFLKRKIIVRRILMCQAQVQPKLLQQIQLQHLFLLRKQNPSKSRIVIYKEKRLLAAFLLPI